LYFVVGCLFLDERALAMLKRRSLACCIGLPSIGLALHLAKAGEGGSLLYAALSIPEALCFALGAVALVTAVPADVLIRTHLPRLGRNTLPVYVCHIPVIMALALIDLRAPAAIGPVMAMATAAAVTLICLAFHRLTTANGLTFLFHFPVDVQARLNRRFAQRLAR
jgi:peptidoglycan/LPS O-acetylase OafA/YrhL